MLGDTRSLGSGGGASLSPGRGQSPDRAALQRLSLWDNSGSLPERRGPGGVEARALQGPEESGRRRRRAPTEKGAGPRVPGGQRAKGEGRAPGIVGGRAPERGAGSTTPSGQGDGLGATRTPQGRRNRVGSPARERPAGPGTPEEEGTGEAIPLKMMSGCERRLSRSLALPSP